MPTSWSCLFRKRRMSSNNSRGAISNMVGEARALVAGRISLTACPWPPSNPQHSLGRLRRGGGGGAKEATAPLAPGGALAQEGGAAQVFGMGGQRGGGRPPSPAVGLGQRPH